MAKYDSPRISQLYIEEVPHNLSIVKFKYKVTKKIGNKVIYTSKFMSFNKNKTFLIKVDDDSEKVQADVYLNDKWFKGYILKHYKSDAEIKFDKASLKSTQSLNSENTGHIKELKLSQDAEVGWLLVKKEQTFDSLLKKIYKKVPTRSELDVFRHANAHISDLQDLNLNKKVMPGQIILITNKKHSKQLSEHKKLALEAERIFQFLCSQEGFDPEFYANNFELLVDYLNLAKQVQIAKFEYLKTVDGHKEIYCGDITLNKDAEALNAVGIYSDKFNEKNSKYNEKMTGRAREILVEQLNKDVLALQAAYQSELKNNTKYGNNKHHAAFRKKYYEIFLKIEQTVSNNFVVMKDNKEFSKTLKNIVKDTSGVRAPDFMGGLKFNVSLMEQIGRATISLKLGMKLVLYFYIAESATKVYGAYNTGDSEYAMKVTTVEVLYLGTGYAAGMAGTWLGGLAGGAAAGALTGSQVGLVLGIPTGGTSVAIGAAIGGVVGGVAAGFWGGYAGTKLGREITEVCK